MAITNYIPELWSAQLLSSLKKNLVAASSAVVNRNWEGEIKTKGDRVRITSIGRPTVKNYTKNTDIDTPQDLTDAQRVLIADQQKYENFQIDDIDAFQAAGNLMVEAMDEASYAFSETIDSFIIGHYTSVDAGNALGATQCTTADKVFQMLIALRSKLNVANVPRTGRYCFLPDFCVGLLLQDNRLVANPAMAAAGQNLQGGSIYNPVLGFNILESNSLPNTAGDDWLTLAGHPRAITFAEQFTKNVAYTPEKRFGDAIKMLYVYGAKVVYPSALATAEASIT